MALWHFAPERRKELTATRVATLVAEEAESLPHAAEPPLDLPIGGNPHRRFVGSPFLSTGFGMFHEVVADLLRRRVFGSPDDRRHVEVLDLTGTLLPDLLQALVQLETPIVLWTTLKQQEPYYKPDEVWRDEKNTTAVVRWLSPEHCLALVGYDLTSDKPVVLVNDPDTGRQERYDLDVFERRYESLGRQAVSLRRTK